MKYEVRFYTNGIRIETPYTLVAADIAAANQAIRKSLHELRGDWLEWQSSDNSAWINVKVDTITGYGLREFKPSKTAESAV